MAEIGTHRLRNAMDRVADHHGRAEAEAQARARAAQEGPPAAPPAPGAPVDGKAARRGA